mmetsp:Transcript_8828/g.23757  ORF Transcript_8828/g.23757 Transcript_8828/m.23757 type:complete len:581 (-) Transcript_8828:638-2380(-)
MAHRLLRDPQSDGWERSDMPIVCETCLGPNPFVRMQRIEYGGACHISGRPYTVFRWRPGSDARYKKTIICQEVAKSKNVCQVCLLDLEYNLPVQVRDQALGMSNEDEPQSDVGKEFQLHQRVKEGENGSSFSESKPSDLLLRLQRTTPYYKRNMARVCSFFAKGTCTRGAECPYRHEMPTTGELSEQNIKDRYYGINDPVANKMMRRVGELPTLEPPEDTSITTLFVGGLTGDITEADLQDHFYAFGEIAAIRKVDAKACAFITYTSRAAAEKAAKELYGKLIIKGTRLRLSWGKPQQVQAGRGPQGAEADPMQPSTTGRPPFIPPQAHAAMAARQQQQQQQDLVSLYPSMAPDQMGTRIPAPGDKPQPQQPGSKRPAGVDAAPEIPGGMAAAGEEGPPMEAGPPKRARNAQAGPPPLMPPPQGSFPPHGYGVPPPGSMPPPMRPPPMRPPPPGAPQMPPPGAPPPGYIMPPHAAPMMPPPGRPYGGPPPMMPPPQAMGPPPPGFGPRPPMMMPPLHMASGPHGPPMQPQPGFPPGPARPPMAAGPPPPGFMFGGPAPPRPMQPGPGMPRPPPQMPPTPQ